MKAPIDVSRLRHRVSHAPRRPLPWFVTPVDKTHSLPTENNEKYVSEEATEANPIRSQESSDSNNQVSHESSYSNNHLSHESTHTSTAKSTKDPRAVVFKTRHESTAIELFYDLFFVANLTVFTDKHEIDDPQSMASYLGFFSLIWFTWYQVSLFDVRFATNSAFNRLAKSVHLFVMGLFAFSGANFNTSDVEVDFSSFRLMAAGLALQRGCLFVQYGTILWYVRKYRAAMFPVACTMAVMFATTMIFLGLDFAFPRGENTHAYIGFYVVSLIEALIVVLISSTFRTVGYRHTNLVERVGLLTLIIIGEGVIGVIRSISTALSVTTILTNTMVALSFSALLVLHELWILYFDQIEHDRFGTIRQQLWAFLHFPFHMALILCLQGLSRFLIWKSFYDAVEHSLAPFFTNQTYNNATEFLNILTEDLTVFQEKFRGTEFVDFYNYTQDLADISRLNFSNHHGEQKAINLTTVILDSAIDYIFHVFQITVPEKISNKKAITQALIDGVRVFTTAFFYFIIGSGFVLLLLGVLYWFGKRHKSRYEWASLVLRFVSGIALALVVLTIYQNEVVVSDGIRISTDQAAFILDKQWVIPIVLLVFATVILLDDILIWLGWKRYEATKGDGEWEEGDQQDQLGQAENI